MNTISPPPQIKRLSGPKRFFGVLVGITGGLGANALLAYSVSSFYTRNTRFVPYDTSSPDLTTKLFRAHNPLGNPPGCIDHAVKEIPYGKLPQKYWIQGGGGKITVDQKALTTDFCRGVWSGVAFRVQRRYLERKYRGLEGRSAHLWDVKELARSEYPIGTGIVDHFEVVEHTDDKVCLCVFLFCFPHCEFESASADLPCVRLTRLLCGAAIPRLIPTIDHPTACFPWRCPRTMRRRWLHFT